MTCHDGSSPSVGDHDHDLLDSVIQRLFAVGLGLQSTLAAIADPALRERVGQSVTALDEIIGEVRSALRAGRDRRRPRDHGERPA